jgi:hypothetical protein
MKVRNINGTSQNTCPCGSWIAHWEKFSGKTAEYCSVVACTNKVKDGAHVQRSSTTDEKWYIIPLCKEHDNKANELTISDFTVLVHANVRETCGK